MGLREARLPLAELDGLGGATRVLAVLTEARLLTIGDGEVELSHEALLHEWPRYRGWLDEDRVGRRVAAHLAASAHEWDARGRDAADLYRGTRLAAAEERAKHHPDDLGPRQRAFLRASRIASERALRRLRLRLAALAVLLVLAVCAGVLALIQRHLAGTEARLATARKLGATQARQPTGASRHVRGGAIDHLSADGRRLGVGVVIAPPRASPRGQVVVWRLPDAHLQSGPANVTAVPNQVAFSTDGRLLGMALADGRVIVANANTGRPRHTLHPVQGDNGGTTSLAFGPSGTLAVGDYAGILQTWNAVSGTPLSRPVLAAPAPISSISFNPSGTRIATTGGPGGGLELWLADSLQQVGATLDPESGSWGNAGFTPDGRTLISVTANGDGSAWPVDPASWAAHACAVAGRNLTQAEWTHFVSDHRYSKVCPEPNLRGQHQWTGTHRKTAFQAPEELERPPLGYAPYPEASAAHRAATRGPALEPRSCLGRGVFAIALPPASVGSCSPFDRNWLSGSAVDDFAHARACTDEPARRRWSAVTLPFDA